MEDDFSPRLLKASSLVEGEELRDCLNQQGRNELDGVSFALATSVGGLGGGSLDGRLSYVNRNPAADNGGSRTRKYTQGWASIR